MLVGIGACLASGFMSLKVLSNVTNLGSLTAFAIVCITVIYLRFAEPNLARPFKVPLYPVVPILSIVGCFWIIKDLRAVTIYVVVIWSAVARPDLA